MKHTRTATHEQRARYLYYQQGSKCTRCPEQ